MLIITMTTVGFGDLTPKTMLGRFCVGITAIVGIFLMALFISLVNEALMLQRREKRILAYVENQGMSILTSYYIITEGWRVQNSCVASLYRKVCSSSRLKVNTIWQSHHLVDSILLIHHNRHPKTNFFALILCFAYSRAKSQ